MDLQEKKKVNKWVQKAEKKGEIEHGVFPKDFFKNKKTAEGYATGLVKHSGGDVGKAIKRLNFYLNRNSDAPNRGALKGALKILEKRLEKQKTKKENFVMKSADKFLTEKFESLGVIKEYMDSVSPNEREYDEDSYDEYEASIHTLGDFMEVLGLGTDSLEDFGRAIYKGTDCGAWVAVTLEDGTEVSYHDEKARSIISSTRIKSVLVGSIVEGSDAEIGPYTVTDPSKLSQAIENVNEEAKYEWENVNGEGAIEEKKLTQKAGGQLIKEGYKVVVSWKWSDIDKDEPIKKATIYTESHPEDVPKSDIQQYVRDTLSDDDPDFEDMGYNPIDIMDLEWDEQGIEEKKLTQAEIEAEKDSDEPTVKKIARPNGASIRKGEKFDEKTLTPAEIEALKDEDSDEPNVKKIQKPKVGKFPKKEVAESKTYNESFLARADRFLDESFLEGVQAKEEEETDTRKYNWSVDIFGGGEKIESYKVKDKTEAEVNAEVRAKIKGKKELKGIYKKQA